MELTSTSKAILLGLIQGLTEFLPVSSSGHLVISSWLLDGKPLPLTLNIALHAGTTLAVFCYFWRDWVKLANAAFRKAFYQEKSFESERLLPSLILGSIPAGLTGILWEDEIEALFHHPISVAIPLALVGILIWLADKHSKSTRHLESLRIKDAIVIGAAQAIALIPGVSRSGITIMTGRLLTFNREDAAKFSFLLGAPAMAGAFLLEAKHILKVIHEPNFINGITVAFISGLFAISFLLKFLRRFGFGLFAVYRLTLAGLILYTSLE